MLIRVSPEQLPVSVNELSESLEELVPQKAARLSGLFTILGRTDLFERRHFTYINTMKLFRKADRWATFLRHVPYVRAAAISGSAAQMNSSNKSDIDLFIITAPKRIFLARFLVSAYFQLLGMRRHSDKIVARFCLNHYVITGLQMPQDKNNYTAMEYSSFISLFGYEFIEEFFRINSPWINEYFLQPQLPQSHVFEHAKSRQSPIQKFLESIFAPFAAGLERLTAFFQKRRIHQSEFVIVSDTQLSFHPDSKGQRILGKYREV